MFDKVWYRDPLVLLQRPLEFFPTRDMTHAERLNSMVRFVLYTSSAIAMYRADYTPLAIGAVVIVVLSIVFSATPNSARDTRESETCTAPTPGNPFMNVLTDEYMASKPGACKTTSATLKKSQQYFDEGLPRELSDVYLNRASDRQFVTMPASGTNGAPDTLAFRNFLFSETAKGPKCK